MSSNDPILAAWKRQRRDRPDDTLLVGGDAIATVADVEGIAVRLAREAAERGLEAGSKVVLCAANGPGFLAGLLGLLRGRLVAVLVDARTPRSERQRLAAAFDCRAELSINQAWPHTESWSWSDTTSDTRESVGGLPAGTTVLKVTSGSTGEPQAVTMTSEALIADEAALSTTMGIGNSERILAAIPLSHSYGLCSVALPAIVRGNVLVVPEPGHPFAAMHDSFRHQVTFLPTVPAYLQGLVRASKPPPAPSSLRRIVSAGAPLLPETAAAVYRLYHRRVHVFYGASECGGISYDRLGTAAERGTLGTPIEGVSVELEPWEGESGRGVVKVRSAAVASGYYPQPSYKLGGGSFLTSDLGSWDQGELRLHGRVDATINVRGKNVDPLEVESLLREYPGVEDVAVVGIPDVAGAGELVRAVVAGSDLTAESLRQWCLGRLADHKVPRSVILVDRLPRSDRGKLDRRALIAMTGLMERTAASE